MILNDPVVTTTLYRLSFTLPFLIAGKERLLIKPGQDPGLFQGMMVEIACSPGYSHKSQTTHNPSLAEPAAAFRRYVHQDRDWLPG